MNAQEIYDGSDGEATKRFYALLEQRGPVGQVAVALFRAQKCSARAKVYRGGVRGHGSYRSMAYDRKSWSMSELCKILEKHQLGIVWGWKEDPAADFNRWVLYVDLPGIGQVSFHSPNRMSGPDYPRDWDRQHASAERVIQFASAVLGEEQNRSLELGIIYLTSHENSSTIDSCLGQRRKRT